MIKIISICHTLEMVQLGTPLILYAITKQFPSSYCLVNYSMHPARMPPGLQSYVGQGMQATVIPC